MGRSGISIRIEPVDSGVSTTEDAIGQAIHGFLRESWERMLGPDWCNTADLWISMGEDSLLTIEVRAPRVTFWFYDSVEWPIGLAEHWLELALATRRCWLDERLHPLGYRLDLSTIPSIQPFYRRSESPYLVQGKRIGRAEQGQLHWVNERVPPTPCGELDRETRAALETGWCHCPACRWFDNAQLCREAARAAPGWELEIVDAHSLSEEGRVEIVFDRGEVVLVLSAVRRSRFAWLRGGPGGPWRRIDPAPTRDWSYLALDPRDGTWVARTEAGEMLQSTDGERWTPLEGEGPPRAAMRLGQRGPVIWLAGEGALWRSTDAGRTFARRPGLDCEAIEGAGPLLAAMRRYELWVSEDDGASWRQAELPAFMSFLQVRVDAEEGALVVSGTEEPEETAAVIVSRDGGRSWSWWARGLGQGGHELDKDRWGRWWWSLSPARSGAPGLFTSPALGAPWEPCADAVCDGLFADPDEPDTVWGCSLGTVLRVRRRVQ
jgi:hypothetical protein